MPFYKKIHGHLLILIAFSFLLSCSFNNSTKLQDEEAITENEILLDSLIQKINKLNVKVSSSEFIILYTKAIETLDRLPDTNKLQGDLRVELIPKLDEVGAYEEAIKQSWKYLDYVELKDESAEGDGLLVYGLLAGIYNAIGNIDSAYIVYELAVRESTYHPDELQLSSALNNMALFFNNLGSVDSALVHFNLADSVLNAYPDKTDYWKKFHGTVESNIANLYFDLGEYEKAKMQYQQMFELYKKLGIDKGIIYSGISIVRSNIELGNCKGQEEFLNTMSMKLNPQNFSQKLDFNLYLWEVYINLYLCTGDINNAFFYQQKSIHLKDSLNKIKEEAIIKSNSQIRNFTTKQFNYQLQVEKAERKKDEQTAGLRFWIILLIALIITITSIILIIYNRQRSRLQNEKTKVVQSKRLLTEEKLKTRNQEKHLLELELDFKKKDLADMAMSISQKQDWATKLIKKVELIESLRGNKRANEFKELKKEIQGQVNIDKELSLLNQNIDNLNKEFYNNLKSRFPDLSKTEVKLCSFIKLKLSNAQVAQLQNIDPSSVKVSRYRLKKKLGLGPNQNLDEFLTTL